MFCRIGARTNNRQLASCEVFACGRSRHSYMNVIHMVTYRSLGRSLGHDRAGKVALALIPKACSTGCRCGCAALQDKAEHNSFDHMLQDMYKCSLNPMRMSCFTDEDFLGKLKRIAVHCHGATVLTQTLRARNCIAIRTSPQERPFEHAVRLTNRFAAAMTTTAAAAACAYNALGSSREAACTWREGPVGFEI